MITLSIKTDSDFSCLLTKVNLIYNTNKPVWDSFAEGGTP